MRLLINSLGDGAILVADTNGPIENGDFLQASPVPGYAERQSTNALSNCTIAKATMDCDFDPQMVPKMKIAMLPTGEPALDANGFVVWNQDGDLMEPEYEMAALAWGCKVARISVSYHAG